MFYAVSEPDVSIQTQRLTIHVNNKTNEKASALPALQGACSASRPILPQARRWELLAQ